MMSRNEAAEVTAMAMPTPPAGVAPRSMNLLTPRSEVPAPGRAGQRRPPEVARVVAELVGDPEQPVVLGDPLRPGRRAGLDLAGAHRDDEVADRRVLGLAGAVRDDRRPAGPSRELDRVNGLGQRPDLVELDEDGVRGLGLDRSLDALGVRHEQVVADQ